MIAIKDVTKFVRGELSILENPRTVFSVLGCICNNASLLREKTTILKKEDFQNPLYRIIFAAINNIIKSDAKIECVRAEDIDNYLVSYPEYHKIFVENNYEGFKFISEAISSANNSLFGVNYQRLKKFSLLRHYYNYGFDIRTLYDYEEAMSNFVQAGKLNEKIENMSQQDIIDFFTAQFLTVRDKWETEDGTKTMKVKDKVLGFTQRKKESPSVGLPFESYKYNELFKGKNKGRLFMRSADTGNGKSRLMMKDAAHSACDMWYDYKKGWIRNGNREKVLYISTELDEEEIITMLIAATAGVGTDEIDRANYGTAIADRLQVAEEILSRAEIFVEEIEDFTIQDIENIIEKHIIEHGVTEVYFDYIQITPKLTRFMSDLFGISLREDQILVFFAQALKQICKKYNVFMSTSTQLSRDENWDARRLAGGKATANKVDHGVIISKIQKEHLKGIANILKSNMNFEKPNYCHFIYKNRKGRDMIIIFTKMNLGCGREEFCFATNYNYDLVNVADFHIDVELIDYSECNTLPTQEVAPTLAF